MAQKTQEQPAHNFDPSLFLPVEPVKMFDDLYFIGNRIVGIYVLKTSEGLVLIEATDNVNADDDILKPSLKKLGLENEKILALLLTHGHFDHYLGAPKIQERIGCPVGMSMEDTAYMSWCDENIGPDKARVVPRITKLLKDKEVLVYGDHSIYVMLAPGHTPGCLNFSFEVHDHGQPHRIAMMGGYGVFGPGAYPDGAYPYGVQWGVDQALAFASSCVKLWEYCKETGCDVFLNPHPHLCNLFDHAEKNKNAKDGNGNAFVIGTEGVRQWIVERFNVCIASAQKFTDIQSEYNG